MISDLKHYDLGTFSSVYPTSEAVKCALNALAYSSILKKM